MIAPALGFNSGLLWRNPLGNLTLEAAGDYFHNGEVRRRLSLNPLRLNGLDLVMRGCEGLTRGRETVIFSALIDNPGVTWLRRVL